MKLLHNYVSIGMVTLLAEAAACAAEQGIPHDVFVDILAKGGGGGVALERMKPWLLARDPSGLRFSVDNARKDLSYYTTMADDGGSAQTIAHAIHTTLAHHAETSPARMLPELVDLLRASGASPVPTPTGSGG